VIGLDIGTFSVKAVKLQRLVERPVLVRAESVPVGPEAGQQARLKAVGAALEKVGARDLPLVASVGGTGTVLRLVTLPKMAPQELRTALSFEAEKYIPFRLEEVFFDCTILGDRPNGQMEVFLAAARRELVDDVLVLLAQEQVRPAAVDLDLVALANAWEGLGSAKGEEAAALIHVGHRGTLIDFFRGPRLQFAREIALGGGAFTRAVAEGLHLDASEAERLKCQPDGRAGEARAALQRAWDEWLAQCRVSFDFYENQYGRRVERLLLTGGSAALSGFREWVQEETGLATQVWDPLVGMERGPEADVPEGARVALPVALGLAVRGAVG